MAMTPVRGLLIVMLFTVFACLPVSPSQAALAPPGPFEQVTNNIIPAAYGELLNIYGESLGKGAPETLQEISGKLSFYAQTIGRVSGALDIGGKLYLGENQEAAISGGLLILGEMAGSEAGKAYLGAMGLTTLPVTTLITAYQIYQISEAELKKSTVGLKLESLYGMIEADPKLKNRQRDVGVGDPIPVTSEALEYLWRKVMLEDRWRDLFKTYVVEELGKDWPEPDKWSIWSLPGNVLEEAEMYERRDELKSYIAGLLSYLNQAAKLREQQYVMRKYGDELKQKSSGMSSSALLNKYMGSVGMLPEVREFVKNCPERIQQGLNGNDLSPLIQVVNNSKRYAVDVVAWLPSSGKLGGEREKLLQELSSYHDKAWAAREFLQEKRRREELLLAQSAEVTVWRASSYGFSLIFATLQRAIEEEYRDTGVIDVVQTRIAEQSRNMKKHYDDQVLAVQNEYEQAQQMRPIPPERNKDALIQFSIQLGAYRSIDQQLLNDLNEEVSAYIDTLRVQAELDVNRLGELAADVDRRIQSFQSGIVSAGRRVGGVGEFEDTLAGYCGDFPSSGYVGLGRLNIPKLGTNTDYYTGLQSSYLDSLSRTTALSSSIQFCGEKAPLSSLIASIDQLVSLVERFAERKADIVELAEKVRELEDLLAEMPLSSNQRILEYRAKDLAERQKPFVLRLQELLQKGESLKGPARSAQQRYQTDLENIENDAAYLHQLQRTLGRLQPILQDFVATYNNAQRNEQYMFKGPVIVLPELVAASGQPICKALMGRRALMTAAEIREALRKLDQTLAENRLIWLDGKYQLGLRDYVALYVAQRSRLTQAITPDYYTFVEWKGECRLFTKEYFDTLKARIEGVDKEGVYFLRNLEKAVFDYSGMRRELLSITVHNYPVDGVNIDLDNYPANGLDFLREIAKNCWEDKTRTSVLGVVSAFAEKLAAYRAWQEMEAHFQKKLTQFEALSGKFSSLEYDAQAANNALADNAELIRVFNLAAAMEPSLTGFLAGAANDPGLSSTRKEYFTRQLPNYSQRFYLLQEMLRNLKLRTNNVQPEQPAGGEEEIKEFYEVFRQNYANKNESGLLSHLSDTWEAGDGTTLFDVEDYFRNMFSVFDEIQFTLSGLKVKALGNRRYLVNYDTLITGRIFADGLVHEEKSSVSEEVEMDQSGKVKIIRTPQGRFWYVN
jgi:hypothetical protein